MKRESGFTMIELLVTLAVAAMLLSMAVPAMRSFSNNSKQTGAINEFVASMHMARNTAITTNARVTMCASSNGTSCEVVTWNQGWIVFTDSDSDQVIDLDERLIGASKDADGLTIQSGEFARFVMFRPNGRVMNATIAGSSGEFDVCDYRGANHAKVIIVDLSGRPRVSKTSADGSAPSCV